MKKILLSVLKIMLKQLFKKLLTPLLIASTTSFAALPCESDSWDKNRYLKWQQEGLKFDETSQSKLVWQLHACLSSTDPVLRDQIAYASLSNLLRKEKMSIELTLDLHKRLLSELSSGADTNDLYPPFAVLMLSETARVDRITPYLSDAQRNELVDFASQYMSGITDYRGFNEQEGWRHNVAHTADLILQLALNKAIDKNQLSQLLDAIASQISPAEHNYIFGEPGRLARAVAYIFLRGMHNSEEQQEWFNKITAAEPMTSWQASYSSVAGLIRRHNTYSFLSSFYSLVGESDNAILLELKKHLIKAIEQLG